MVVLASQRSRSYFISTTHHHVHARSETIEILTETGKPLFGGRRPVSIPGVKSTFLMLNTVEPPYDLCLDPRISALIPGRLRSDA